MALNRLGVELFEGTRPPAPVTLPALAFLKKGPPTDDEPARKEIADKFAEFRIIKAGAGAWAALAQAERETYALWKAVAASLAIGRNHALRAAGTDTPKGPRYAKALSHWLELHFGGRPLPKQTRYWCILLHENLSAIEAWRQSLSERERSKLINPQAVVRRFLRAKHPKVKSTDPVKAATVAWNRFAALARHCRRIRAAPYGDS